MLKQTETLWTDSQSQPRPIFESPPESRDLERLRLLLERGAVLVAVVAAVGYLLYAFWLRPGPPMLFGPLGSVGTVGEGDDGFWNSDISALIDELPLTPDRQGELAGVGANSDAAQRAGATDSDRDDGAGGRHERRGRRETLAVTGGLGALINRPPKNQPSNSR